MGDRRRFAAIIVLFAIGFGMIALANAVSSAWPLFLTPIPYAIIPWLVVHADDRTGAAEAERPRNANEGA